jgi:hypothetical protein
MSRGQSRQPRIRWGRGDARAISGLAWASVPECPLSDSRHLTRRVRLANHVVIVHISVEAGTRRQGCGALALGASGSSVSRGAGSTLFGQPFE